MMDDRCPRCKRMGISYCHHMRLLPTNVTNRSPVKVDGRAIVTGRGGGTGKGRQRVYASNAERQRAYRDRRN